MSVIFGPGLSIESVTPLAEALSSTIVLSDLPTIITDTILYNMCLGSQPSLTLRDIRIQMDHRNSTTTESITDGIGSVRLRATIQFQDAKTALEVCETFKYANYQCEIFRSNGFHSSSAGLQDATKIHCRWYAPSRVAFVEFASHEEALAVSACSRSKQIRGRILKFLPPKAFRSKFSVMLLGLDPSTTEEEIADVFGCSNSAVTLKEARSNLSNTESTQYVKRLFETENGSGPGAVASFEVISDRAASVQRAVVTFNPDDVTRTTFKRLNGRDLDSIGGGKLSLELKYSTKFVISAEVYRAVVRELDSLAVAAKSGEYGGTAGDTTRGGSGGGGKNCTTIKIFGDLKNSHRQASIFVQGSERQAVATAKAAIRKIISGEVVCDEQGHSIWDSGLNKSDGRALVKRSIAATGAYAYCDVRNRTITLYGSLEVRDKARNELIKAYEQWLAGRCYEIPLVGNSVLEALAGGFTAVQEHLTARGLEMAEIDVPGQRLLVRCGPSELAIIKRLVNRQGQPGSTYDPKAMMCVSCFDDAEELTQAACGHTYCKTCIADYLRSVRDTRKFPITCFGESDGAGATCGEPFVVDFIHQCISKTDADELRAASFLTYVQQHPADYHFCPTPDCDSVYAVHPGSDTGTAPATNDGKSTAFTCPQCLVDICTYCKTEFHDGQTCDDHLAAVDVGVSEARFREWKRANNVKSCPTCSADIEKTEGCDHMECRCGTHMCWRCLGVFKADTIYDHMGDCHGVNPANAGGDREAEAQEADAAFREWRRRNGVQVCPNCGFDIVREGGDDHVQCQCGEHLCWRCMRVVDLIDVFDHIRTCTGRPFPAAPYPPAHPPPRRVAPGFPFDEGDLARLGRLAVEARRARFAETAMRMPPVPAPRRLVPLVEHGRRRGTDYGADESGGGGGGGGWGCVLM